MPEVVLAGCRPEPLAAYLKGLGIFRLVAEQVDPAARARWVEDELRLDSTLELDRLVEFLVSRYRPTPLVAPWNKGSGFGADDPRTSPKATATVAAIRDSDDPRLAGYRRTIEAVDSLRDRPGWHALAKEQQVALCRSVLPDEVIGWLDATVVLTTESRAFPPLLGTGGNDGRFDFASNFMDRVLQLFRLRARARHASSPEELARAALTGEIAPLDRAAIGQFDPAGAGGPGSSGVGAAEALANPWDFVLLLEGALLFASGAARRMSGQAATSVPFMVRATAAGHPTAIAGEGSRGELWAPLWSTPASFDEVSRLIGEGRAEFSGRQAVSGLDLVRALATLGVDRGLSGFVRHSFLERNGLATFAVPVGRVVVRARTGSALTGQLDGWLQSMRRASNVPGSFEALVRRVDDRIFALAADGGALALQRVLVGVAELDRLGSRSSAVRRAAFPLAARLRAHDWIPELDDGSPEHELAVALASLRIGDGGALLRALLTDLYWTGRPPAVDGFVVRPIAEVLADTLVRVSVEHGEERDEAGAVRWLAGARAVPARLSVVEEFVTGGIDDERLGDLLGAYLLLDWRFQPAARPRPTSPRRPMPAPAFTVLRPFFHIGRIDLPGLSEPLAADASWARRLISGQVVGVVGEAIRKLRIAGLEPLVRGHPESVGGVEGTRLAAACLIPIFDLGAVELVRQVTAPSESDQPSNLTEEPA